MWRCGNVVPSERTKPCSDKGLLPKSNIASVAMLLGTVAMLLVDPGADLPCSYLTDQNIPVFPVGANLPPRERPYQERP